jgi:hypothetical protein
MKVAKRAIRDVGAHKIPRKRALTTAGRALRERKGTFLVGSASLQVVPARLPGLGSKASAENGAVTSEGATISAIPPRFRVSNDGPPTRTSGFTDDKARFITRPATFPARLGRLPARLGRPPT